MEDSECSSMIDLRKPLRSVMCYLDANLTETFVVHPQPSLFPSGFHFFPSPAKLFLSFSSRGAFSAQEIHPCFDGSNLDFLYRLFCALLPLCAFRLFCQGNKVTKGARKG
ncbi:hypothetical protein MUK42_37555 [Musa troglodytarum]|uniref:Uncharacterized protein n=1 Tax=Musa troglodytarum TaxID=320322 RepID=A0A9E7JZ61_9LILI|nr:hypothetical protein MUK42_37555 [Musa troglodytarum]